MTLHPSMTWDNLKEVVKKVILLSVSSKWRVWNQQYSKGSFLDLGITMVCKKSKNQLYDKRNGLPFLVVRMLHLTGNISYVL